MKKIYFSLSICCFAFMNTFAQTPCSIRLTSATNTAAQGPHENEAITHITYYINGGQFNISGLPTGITASLNAQNDTVTISGCPAVQGSFYYTVTATGSCSPDSSLTGSITVGVSQAAGSFTQTVCINTPISAAIYNGNNDSISPNSALPVGVSAVYDNISKELIINGTPSVQGVFNYTITSHGACGSYQDGRGQITVYSPTVTANASANTVCAGAAVILTGSGASSYTWTAGITDGLSFIPVSTATYTVTGTDTNACVNTATQMITVSLCNGIERIDTNTALEDVIIYPNPNNGVFTIESTSEGTYSIINELGQIIQQLKLNSTNKYSINIENLSNGIYFIVGFNYNRTTHKKIVVIK